MPTEIDIYHIPPPPDSTDFVTAQDAYAIVGSAIRNMNEPAVMQQNFMQSANFIDGVSGWKLTADGFFKGVGVVVSGTITATGGTIGGFTISSDNIADVANSFGLASTVSGSDDVRFWAGATFANRATAPIRVTEAGAVTATSITVGGTTTQYTITDSGISSFGDGSDGALTTSGDVTLAADKYYTDLTVASTNIVNPAGYRIFVSGTLTVNGKIARNGVNGEDGHDAAGGSGGTALADGYLKGSLVGGAAGVGNGAAGSAGGNTSNSIGSDGAAGGAGQTGAGGAGGTATTSNVKLIANWHLNTLLDVGSTGATVKFNNSAAAGGGGNGNPQGRGGGGASAGGIVAIYARKIVIGNTGANSYSVNRPHTGANDASFGTLTWTLPLAASHDYNPGTGTVAVATGPGDSKYNKLTNFGFTLPSTATICGIKVSARVRADGGGAVSDASIRLVKGGTISGNDNASGHSTAGSSTFTYGSSSDLWGLTWAHSDINASNFGVAISLNQSIGADINLSIVTIEVFLSSGIIEALGGFGGQGSEGAQGGGGGGGGNGGQVVLVYNTLTNSGVISAGAGTGGPTGGTGSVAGTDGTTGTIRQFAISL